jgi:hypothetical protein
MTHRMFTSEVQIVSADEAERMEADPELMSAQSAWLEGAAVSATADLGSTTVRLTEEEYAREQSDLEQSAQQSGYYD